MLLMSAALLITVTVAQRGKLGPEPLPVETIVDAQPHSSASLPKRRSEVATSLLADIDLLANLAFEAGAFTVADTAAPNRLLKATIRVPDTPSYLVHTRVHYDAATHEREIRYVVLTRADYPNIWSELKHATR